jgi:hypothetical protein
MDVSNDERKIVLRILQQVTEVYNGPADKRKSEPDRIDVGNVYAMFYKRFKGAMTRKQEELATKILALLERPDSRAHASEIIATTLRLEIAILNNE